MGLQICSQEQRKVGWVGGPGSGAEVPGQMLEVVRAGEQRGGPAALGACLHRPVLSLENGYRLLQAFDF